MSSLSRLNDLWTDDANWDPLLIELTRLKQWCPEIYDNFIKKYGDEIETLKNVIVEKKCLHESLIMKALDFDTNLLKLAKDNIDLQKMVEAEFPPGCFTRWEYQWHNSKYMSWAYEIFMNKHGHTFQVCLSNLPYNSHYQMVILALLKMKANGDEWLKELIIDHFDKILLEMERDNATYLLQKVMKVCGEDPTADKLVSHYVRQPIQAQLKKSMRPFERRYQRLIKAFEPAQIKLTDADRTMIELPFPILMASTKTKSRNNGAEFNLAKAKLGDEIDLLFTNSKHIHELTSWVEIHQLNDAITIKDMNVLHALKDFPLIHSDRQIGQLDPFLSKEEHIAIGKLIAKHAPLYRGDYSNGSKRIHHGVSHALRTYFFALTLAELYKENGFAFKSEKSHLLLSVMLHDCARQNDGIDLWDKQSGEMAQKILLEDLTASEEAAAHMMRCIADKDLKPVFALEQKIIHDADCLEIMRCLHNNEDFKPDELLALQDIDQETIFNLIDEAKHFISMTECPTIKEAITISEDPVALLFQILNFANEQNGAFQLLSDINRAGIKVFGSSECMYALSEEIESTINNYFNSKNI
ncbi:MAG: hypothetical protein H0V82_07585 [Candidatus Protochlamydia sp.]|nr:hypothetical protein [Candidatus Protochlamydia sp.]